MQNIVDLSINYDVDYVRRHKHQLEHFFKYYSETLPLLLPSPLLAYTIHYEQFDAFGTLWFDERDLDKKSLRLVQKIEDSYMLTSFFSKQDSKIGSRGYVYYCSATQDEDRMRAMLRLINHADTSAKILQKVYQKHQDRWEFGIYALLDDLRYKLLILDECFEYFRESSDNLINMCTTLFYDYLQGSMPSNIKIDEFIGTLREFFSAMLAAATPLPLRTYKEADNPLQNLIFRDALMMQLSNTQIDVIIGIRFGGAELPYLIKRYIPNAKIINIKVSNYNDNLSHEINFGISDIPTGNVLILDDNILTGRTLQKIITALKLQKVRGAYFGCVTYSGMKRYPQMIMEGHGVVNPEVLRCSCVVGESDYTRITSSGSYKNKNGVFDKVKSGLQKRMDDTIMGYKL